MKKNRPVSILVVDDDRTHRVMLKAMLKQWGWQIEEADDGTTAIEAVHRTSFDAILMDVRMTKLDGIEALRQIHTYNPAIPVVIMTAYSSVDAAVEAIKIGAHDYLTKPLDFDRLKFTMTHALGHRHAQENKDFSRNHTAFAMDAGGIIARSGPMRELMEITSYVAPTEATVLISGESGTGKELIASALHHNSTRKNGPFIKVNCAALVENLLESELFGHEKGAFTGADRRREGRFVQANGGTIFLDEISETSPGMQAKLLRVLQEHEVQRVGGQETLAVDARVLAASNRNLEEEVAHGTFREDLYYRLNVVTLHVPPLRDRREDIPTLAEYFVAKFATKNNRQVSGITPRCMTLLLNYPWPGNVRELENAIERGVILMRGDYLDEENMPLPVRRFAMKNEASRISAVTPPGSLEEAEQIVIKNILAETGGNKSEASRRLDITRKTLLSKMHKYGLT